MKIKLLILACVSMTLFGYSQKVTGVVLDAKTKEPIETATVYFNNTTRGTITNNKGEFSLEYSDAIQSPLVISFLGYKKQLIANYRTQGSLIIQLKEVKEVLDEVFISHNDGLTREEKLKIFKKEFLGTSKFGKSCTILNDDALVLKYLQKEKRLVAHSASPLKIINKRLQYTISYDLNSFSAEFTDTPTTKNNFKLLGVSFTGNPYYQDMVDFDKKKARRNRKKSYQGSSYHFMRSLYADKLKKQKFRLFEKRNEKDTKDVFNITFKDSTAIKKVVPNKKSIVIVYDNKDISKVNILVPHFLIDVYGNYTEVPKIQFSGDIGSKRLGDMLPLDYNLER